MAESALIKLGVDISSVRSAIRQINGDMRALQAESRTIGNTLKLEPSNAGARSRYIANFEEQLTQAQNKVTTLRNALNNALSNGATRETPGVARLQQDLRRAEAEAENLQAKLRTGFSSVSTTAEQGATRITATNGLGIGAAAGAAMSAIQQLTGWTSQFFEGALERADKLTRLPNILKMNGASSDDAKEAVKIMSDGIEGLPTSLTEISDLTKNLQDNFNGSAIKGAQAAVAINDAFLAAGSGPNEVSRGFLQLSQILDRGKPDAQAWHTLLETMRPSLRAVAEELGFGRNGLNQLYDSLQKGTTSMDDFLNAFVKADKGQDGFAKKAKVNSKGILTDLKNIKTSITNALATPIMGNFQPLHQLSNELLKLSKSNSGKVIIQIAGALALMATAAIPIAGVVASFSILGGAIAAISGPVLIITGVIAGAVGAITLFITKTKQGSQIFGEFKKLLGPAFVQLWNSIKNLFASFMPILHALWTVLKPILGIVMTLAGGLLLMQVKVLTTVANVLTWIINLITNFWGTLANTAGAVGGFFVNIWNTIAGWFSNIGNSIAGFFGGLFSRYWDFETRLFGRIKALGSRILNSARSFFHIDQFLDIGKRIIEGIADGIRSTYKKLEKTLSNVKDWVVSRFKRVFEIHSPSRLMRDEVGQFIGLGLGEGITNSLSEISPIVSGVASGLVNSAQRGLNTAGNLTMPAINSSALQKNLNVAGAVNVSIEAGTLAQVRQAAHDQTVKTLRAAGIQAV